MQTDESFYNDGAIKLKLINDLNKNYSTELAELVEMTFGPKPDDELQRLTSARVTSIDASGLTFSCKYHRWEDAEKNDRMFHEHTDEITRDFTVPFSIRPTSKEELLVIVKQMIHSAMESYRKGFQ